MATFYSNLFSPFGIRVESSTNVNENIFFTQVLKTLMNKSKFALQLLAKYQDAVLKNDEESFNV